MELQDYRRILLERHGLVRRFGDPLHAVAAMVGVQTQYAGSLGAAVAARTDTLEPGWDDAAIAHGGPLRRAWTLRCTLHAHLPEDHALVVGVFGKAAHLRYRRWFERQVPGADLDAMEARIVAALRRGPMSRAELHAALPELRDLPMAGWGQDTMGLGLKGRLVLVGRGAEQRFALAEPPKGARRISDLLRRYLQGYGPATVADFSHWTSRPQRDVRAAFEELSAEIEPIHVDGLEGVRYRLKSDPEPGSESLGVRLLAKFDPLVLSHREKAIFLRDGQRKAVFRSAGHVEAVVLSEGEAVATWRVAVVRGAAQFRVEPLRALKRGERAALKRECARMGRAMGCAKAEVSEA